jgi:hypothetical protein
MRTESQSSTDTSSFTKKLKRSIAIENRVCLTMKKQGTYTFERKDSDMGLGEMHQSTKSK